MTGHSAKAGEDTRFEFGKNWSQFLALLDDDRIEQAERSLKSMLEVKDLTEKSFLDIGTGSGIFSLAARRLGAKVHSFDYDFHSVACAAELKRRYFPLDSDWTVEKGSVLDHDYLTRLGTFDVVYSWGVLHHTGDMRRALENVQASVGPGGTLFIAIYNYQRVWSRVWTAIKKTYNRLPPFMRIPFTLMVMLPLEVRSLAYNCLTLQPGRYWRSRKQYAENRGMSRWHDMIDWIGGYPFEVAKPEQIFDFYRERGFELVKLKTCGGELGCNEFVFRRR